MADDPARVLVLLAEGAEEMEVTITVDVLRRAGIEVVLAGLDGAGPVTCSRGVRLVPDVALADVTRTAGSPGEAFAMVVLPGGLGGAEKLGASAAAGALLRAHWDAGGTVGAICAGPTALVQHAIGAGVAMTCHPSVRDVVGAHGALAPGRVVTTPRLITSQGPGTAFEFALAIVARLAGADAAARVAEPMLLPPGSVESASREGDAGGS
jgi:protein DJ-1